MEETACDIRSRRESTTTTDSITSIETDSEYHNTTSKRIHQTISKLERRNLDLRERNELRAAIIHEDRNVTTKHTR
eukprot:6075671-Amphidinium_carterae.1